MWTAIVGTAGKMNSTNVTGRDGRKTTALNEFHRDSLNAILVMTGCIGVAIIILIIIMSIRNN